MVFFNENYEKVWYVHLSMGINRKPEVLVDEYENVVLKQSTLGSFEMCDINCVATNTTRPFCKVCDVFNNEEDANKHIEALILKVNQLMLIYAKEMIQSIREIFKKVEMCGKEQFIAIKYKDNLAKLNFYKVILTDKHILNLEDIKDTNLLYNIIVSLKNGNYFVLSENYNLHKKFASMDIFSKLLQMEEIFSLKLKGYEI